MSINSEGANNIVYSIGLGHSFLPICNAIGHEKISPFSVANSF